MGTEISNWWNVGQANAAALQPGAAQTPPASNQVSKETFLQLLVAQIRHQDPLNPSDSIQFLTQLAQFSELEQLINMGRDLGAIRQGMEALGGGARDAAAGTP